jgi:hypothetical protein
MNEGGGLRAGAGAGCEGEVVDGSEVASVVKPKSRPGLRGWGVHNGGYSVVIWGIDGVCGSGMGIGDIVTVTVSGLAEGSCQWGG